MMTNTAEMQYLSVRQAAAHMNISVSYLRDLAYKAKIKHYKIGAKRLFTVQDINEFLASCAIEPKKQKYINCGLDKRDINLIKRAVLNK